MLQNHSALKMGELVFPRAYDSGNQQQRFDLTTAHLSALDANQNAEFNFRAIHDRDKAKPAIKRRGTIAQHWAELCEWNNKGYGVFVTVAQMDGVADKLENVTAIRAHYVDLDQLSAPQDIQAASGHIVPPQFYVQSSPNRFHAYWVLDPAERYRDNAWFDQQQRKLAQLYHGDARVSDATRVMRLAGFYHHKGEPHLVTCGQLPGWGAWTLPGALAASVAHVNVVQHGGGLRRPLGDPDLAAPGPEWLAEALRLADPNQMDRDDWISFTSAFKQAAWAVIGPDDAFRLWSEWCERYAENDPGENLKQWGDLTETQVGWPAIERRFPTLEADRLFRREIPAQWQQPAATSISAIPAGDSMPQAQASARLLTSLSDLLAQPLSAAPWAIKGILPANATGILFGQPGAGKSFLAIDMAASIASGTAFNGRKVRQGSVIYVAGEGHSGVRNRFHAKFEEIGSRAGTENIHISEKSISFNDNDELQRLMGEIETLPAPPALIVIDTLFRATAGSDVNDHADMAKFWQTLERMKERYGSTVLVVHHSGRQETQRSFGSVVLLANADFEMSVSANDDGTKSLENTKQKEAETFDPICFNLKQVDIGIIKDQWGDFHHLTSCVMEFVEPSENRRNDSKRTKQIAAGIPDAPSRKDARTVACLIGRMCDQLLEGRGIKPDGAAGTDLWAPLTCLTDYAASCLTGGPTRNDVNKGAKSLADRGFLRMVSRGDGGNARTWFSPTAKLLNYARDAGYEIFEQGLDPKFLEKWENQDVIS